MIPKSKTATKQPRPEQASATAYCMDCKREATPLCVAHHDTRTRAVGTAPERGEQPKLIDQLLDAAIYAEDIDRRVAARVRIVKMFDQHSTLIAQRERLLRVLREILTEAEFVGDTKAPFTTWVAEKIRAVITTSEQEGRR